MFAAGALAAPACAREEQVIGRGSERAPGEQPCPQFVPGTNLLTVEWNANPEENAEVATVMQITGDASAASTRVLVELYQACSDLRVVTRPSKQLSEPPSIGQTAAACDDAIGDLETLRTTLMGDAVATIHATKKPCATGAAIQACRDDCADGDTCGAYCTSAAPWLADCPPAEVTITFDRQIDATLQEQWSAVELAVGDVLAARERLGLAIQTANGLGSGGTRNYSLDDEDCLNVLFDTVDETRDASEAANAAIGEIIRTLEITE